MTLIVKKVGLSILLMMLLGSLVVNAEEGDKPCHHNLGTGQHHAHQQPGDKPCDHEKGGYGHHKQGDEPCDHEKGEGAKYRAGDEPCDKTEHHVWRDGLSDQQNQKIDAMHEQLHQKQRELRGKISEKQQQIRQMILVDEPDFPEIRAIVNQITMLRSEIYMRHLLHLDELRKMLTSEQRMQFDKEMHNAPHHHD